MGRVRTSERSPGDELGVASFKLDAGSESTDEERGIVVGEALFRVSPRSAPIWA